MPVDPLRHLALAVIKYDRPWRKLADEIILARLHDILNASALGSMPMMGRGRFRRERAADAYLNRSDALAAMGWADLTQIQQLILLASCRDDVRLETIAQTAGISLPTLYRARGRALDKMYLALADDDVLSRVRPAQRAPVYSSPRGPSGYIPFALRVAVYRRDRFTCLYCGTHRRLSIDHIYPFSKGGPTEFDNLQTLCRSCNSRKGARVLG